MPQAHAMGGLGLAAVDALDVAAEDLANAGTGAQRQRQQEARVRRQGSGLEYCVPSTPPTLERSLKGACYGWADHNQRPARTHDRSAHVDRRGG